MRKIKAQTGVGSSLFERFTQQGLNEVPPVSSHGTDILASLMVEGVPLVRSSS